MTKFRVQVVDTIIREKTFMAECQEDVEEIIFNEEDIDTWEITDICDSEIYIDEEVV